MAEEGRRRAAGPRAHADGGEGRRGTGRVGRLHRGGPAGVAYGADQVAGDLQAAGDRGAVGAARDRQRPGRGGQRADDRPGVTTQEMWNAVADACLAELVRIAGADAPLAVKKNTRAWRDWERSSWSRGSAKRDPAGRFSRWNSVLPDPLDSGGS